MASENKTTTGASSTDKPKMQFEAVVKHLGLGIPVGLTFLLVAHIAVETGVGFDGMEPSFYIGAVSVFTYAAYPALAWIEESISWMIWGGESDAE